MVKDATLYDRLNIQPTADDNEIDKAFKKLAKQYHPDRHSSETEEKKQEYTLKFQEIQQAKDILGDKEKRQAYDQVGMDMLKGGGGGDPDVNAFFHQFQNQFNPFQHMFGGQPQQRQEPKEDIIKNIDVTLEQLYNEETINVSYKYKCSCVKCNGEGTKDGTPSKCSGCNGTGTHVQIMRMGPHIVQQQMTCPHCRGRGKMANDTNKCLTCNGSEHIMKERTIQLSLKCNYKTGKKIQYPHNGHQLKNDKSDLYLIINELPHNLYKRVDNDLITTVDLKMFQAAFGFDKTIDYLNGQKLHISHNIKTDYNTVRKIVGKGMKNSNNLYGDLYIRFTFTLPNLYLLDNSIKDNYKTAFKSFDPQESSNEDQVNINKTKYIATQFVECKDKEASILQYLTMNNEQHVPNNEEGHQRCVHQ
jgi:DnaJ family protein A protein 2